MTVLFEYSSTDLFGPFWLHHNRPISVPLFYDPRETAPSIESLSQPSLAGHCANTWLTKQLSGTLSGSFGSSMKFALLGSAAWDFRRLEEADFFRFGGPHLQRFPYWRSKRSCRNNGAWSNNCWQFHMRREALQWQLLPQYRRSEEEALLAAVEY